MARYYHVEIAALAAGANAKWVDNLLSRFELPGVESARQGVARRISTTGLYHIAAVRRIVRQLGLSIEASVGLARRLLADPNGRAAFAEHLELRLDRRIFEEEVDALVADAVETTAPARRGRPPARPSARVPPRSE